MAMRSLWLGVLMVSALGCGSAKDPCEDETGACITARIEGDGVAVLDQLRFTIDNPVAATTSTPASPSLFGLPVKLALVLPAGATGSVNVSVEGMLKGKVEARSAPQRVTVPVAGVRSAVTFVVTEIAGGDTDMGTTGDMTADMTPPSDLSGGLTVTTTGNSFPDTVRGQRATTFIVVTLTNNGSSTLTLSGTPTSTGDSASFTNETASTCQATMTSFTPGQSCTMVIGFAPRKSGPLSMTQSFSFTDGSGDSFTLTGRGTPAWSNERPTTSMLDFTSVHGTDSSNVYAGGSTTAAAMVSAVWRYNGTQWTAYNTNMLWDKYSVTALAVGTGHVFAGGTSGISFNTGIGADWTMEAMALPRVRGMFVDAQNNAFAITDSMSSGFLGREMFLGNWSWNTKAMSGPFQAVCGKDKNQVYFFSGAILHRWNGVSHNLPPVTPPAILGQVYSCWFDEIRSAIYAIAADTTAPPTSRVYRININGATGNPDLTAPVIEHTVPLAQLVAIHGRHLATGEIDLWAGGSLASSMIYSNGNGTWTMRSVPTNTNVTSIYVAPDGQVFSVGYGADIAHYY
jgi:hypothetical protein